MQQVAEVISGMLPLERRKKLLELTSGIHDKVHVESGRALARSSVVSEQIYARAKENNVEIIATDMPNLFKLDASPAENFMRRVMGAVYEFERDCIVHRLQACILAASKKTKRITQSGAPKVVGRRNLIETIKPNGTQTRQLKSALKKRNDGKFGWRPLRKEVGKILKLKKKKWPSIEACRRLEQQLSQRAR